jgi:streptogramin lyase
VYISATDVFRDTPYAWISNGESKTINRVSIPLDYGDGYENPFVPEVFQTSYSDDAFPVSAVSGEDFGGIYGVAVTPCYNVWTVDPEMDRLFKFDVDGTMLSSIDMPPVGSSPQSVALDSDSNLWITLYNTISTVKYGLDGIQLSSTAIPPFAAPDNTFVRPVQVDTDTDDNIWVTYEHPASSMLIKYDTNGSYLLSAGLPVSAQPFGLVIDPEDDSVWVSNSYEVIVSPYSWQNAASAGEIQHFSASGSLIETFDNIPRPSYLTLDSDSNLWFIFGYSGLGSISGSTVSQYFLSAGEIDVYGPEHVSLDNSQEGLNPRLDGVAVDSRERVWALNSRENAAYVMPLNAPLSAQAITINPSNVSAIERGIQAIGDWTGYQWILKYGSTQVGVITGVSNFISIDNFGEDLEMRKFNESWDAAQQMQDYALSDHINNNPNLFDNYLYAMVGGLSAGEESIGRESYERIANFVPNHVDIDTCGIDQLYSLANELDVPIDDYQFSYPPALKRLINLVSVSHQKLWGTRCRCRTNFKIQGQCSDCGHDHCLNRGRSELDQSTYYVSGAVPFVVSPRFGVESYDILVDTTLPASGVALSAISTINWLASANYDDYYFYKYIPTLCDTQLEGVINWDDQYTTLSENNSSLSAWYDDCETVDIMLSQVLYDGLGLE